MTREAQCKIQGSTLNAQRFELPGGFNYVLVEPQERVTEPEWHTGIWIGGVRQNVAFFQKSDAGHYLDAVPKTLSLSREDRTHVYLALTTVKYKSRVETHIISKKKTKPPPKPSLSPVQKSADTALPPERVRAQLRPDTTTSGLTSRIAPSSASSGSGSVSRVVSRRAAVDVPPTVKRTRSGAGIPVVSLSEATMLMISGKRSA